MWCLATQEQQEQQEGALGDGTGAPPRQPGSKPRGKKAPSMSKRSQQRQALREENGNTAEAEAAARAAQAAEEAAAEEARARAAAIARQEALRQAAAKDEAEDDEDDGYGEDDFDDYDDDDDFEDGSDDDGTGDSPGGARALQRAMRAENASAARSRSLAAPAPAAPPKITMLPTREVVTIETKEATRTKADRKALSRSRTRWRDLVTEGRVTLTESDTASLFDRPPCTLYQVECALGTTGRARRSVQTGEDNITMETQTERPPMRSHGMHAPDDLGLAPGQSQPHGSGLVSQGTDAQPAKGPARLLVNHDRTSLDAFLQRALPVVESMLPNALRIAAPPASTGSDGNLSTGYATLPAPRQDLAVRDVHYWRRTNAGGEDRSTLAVAYGTSQTLDGLDGSGLVCVWNAHDSRDPLEVLCCAGAATCCWMGQLSENRAAGIVVAGTEEGTLAVWDLAQPRFAHGKTSIERWPSYSTDSLVSGNHTAPIVCVRGVPDADDSELAQALAMSLMGSGNSHLQEQDNADKGEKSVQVATMDALGTVVIWSLIQLAPGDPGADPGLGIGGRVKALRMTAVDSPAHPDALSAVSTAVSGGLFAGSLPCFDMAMCPTDSNMLLVGSINGKVHRAARYGYAIMLCSLTQRCTSLRLHSASSATDASGTSDCAGIRQLRGNTTLRMRLKGAIFRPQRALSLMPGQPHGIGSAESEPRRTCCASTGHPFAPTSLLWQWQTGPLLCTALAPPVHDWSSRRLQTCPSCRCGGHAIVHRSCSRWMPGPQFLHGTSPKRHLMQRTN
eukprot:COSAG02_NODE_5977_length_3898_cov_12.007107_2_plen_791_part_00